MMSRPSPLNAPANRGAILPNGSIVVTDHTRAVDQDAYAQVCVMADTAAAWAALRRAGLAVSTHDPDAAHRGTSALPWFSARLRCELDRAPRARRVPARAAVNHAAPVSEDRVTSARVAYSREPRCTDPWGVPATESVGDACGVIR